MPTVKASDKILAATVEEFDLSKPLTNENRALTLRSPRNNDRAGNKIAQPFVLRAYQGRDYTHGARVWHCHHRYQQIGVCIARPLFPIFAY
jgi:hypothetical protein